MILERCLRGWKVFSCIPVNLKCKIGGVSPILSVPLVAFRYHSGVIQGQIIQGQNRENPDVNQV